MSSNFLKNNLSHPLYCYDKQKVNVLKTILPILIIIHHISNLGFPGIELIGASGDVVMYFFFAMSGFGLTISYLKNEKYINGFLQRSLLKLLIPYIFALILFVVYRYFEGIDQVALLREKGPFTFVPTSWYIWILSLFYIFFYIVFRYVKINTVMKVIITCGLVLGYVKFAPHMGMAFWRYLRCPAFCIGMLFALHDNALRERFVRWQALAALCFVLLVISLPYWHRFDSYLYPTALFLFMYCFRSIKETRIVKFISSISLEMFIIQYLPIYIVTDDLNITNTWLVVVLVLILDVIFAYIIHQIILKLQKYM